MSDYLDSLKADRQISRVRESLEKWLKCKDWEPKELLKWLQGYRLPPVGYDYETYVWMVRALLTSDAREELEKELAGRLVELLETHPDVNRPGDRPDEVLYNLFMLCAEIRHKEILGQRLYEVYERGKLNGKWHGLNLRSALRTALTYNQTDNTLKEVWRDMAWGHRNTFLRGRERDGFEGILYMPKKSNSLEPDVDEIGYALKAMSNYLENDHDRRPEFQALIIQVKETYPDRKTWDIDLIYQADRHEWQRWAITCLPNLCLRQNGTVFLWEDAYKSLLNKYEYFYEIERRLCGDKILQIRIRENINEFLDIVAQLETVRFELPFAKYSSVLGAIHYRMVEVEINSFYSFNLANDPATDLESETLLKNLVNLWKRDRNASAAEVKSEDSLNSPPSLSHIALPVSESVLTNNLEKARATNG